MTIERSGLLGAHVVAFPFPTQGHINPFVIFSKHLAEYGIAITFITTTPHLASTQRALLEDESFKACGNIEVVCFDLAMHFAKLNYQTFMALKHVTNNMGDKLEELMKRLMASNGSMDLSSSSRFGPPVCIISDMYLSWTQDIANDFKVPRYCLYPSPMHFLSLMYNLPKMDAQGLTPMPLGAKPLEIPSFPPLAYTDVPRPFRVDDDVFPHEFQVYQAKRLQEAAGVLVNSMYELECDILIGLEDSLLGSQEHNEACKIFTIGPLLDGLGIGNKPLKLKQEAENEDNECLHWLAKQPKTSSVLYICFGTVFVFPTQQMHELATGLESSGVHFLWVVRIPTGEDITTFLPRGFIERTKDRGLVYLSWAPQVRILGHPAIGGFLTHCGWNSVTESMVMGVPMITWPLEGDQMMNGKLCVEILNIAVAVDKKLDEIVGRVEIGKVVQLLMEDAMGDVLRKKAKEVSQIARSTFLPEGSSRKNLNLFVEGLNSLTSINQ